MGQVQQPGVRKEGRAFRLSRLREHRVSQGALGHIGDGDALLLTPTHHGPHVVAKPVNVHDQPWIAHRPMLLFISASASWGYAFDRTPRDAMM